MRIILLKFFNYTFVPALSDSLKAYSENVYIAYKVTLAVPVNIITTNTAVVGGFLLSNTDLLHNI